MSSPPQEGRNPRVSELARPVDRFATRIPVETYIRRYKVEDDNALEALRGNPSLCYLLGRVTETPEDLVNVQTKEHRRVHTLQEGSGMFNLIHPEDALAWKGIFNHIVGSVVHTEFLTKLFSSATPEQIAQFKAKGYDFTSFSKYGPDNLKDVMFVTHAGRRRSDEGKWYELTDPVHTPPGDSYLHTRNLLLEEEAPEPYLEILEVEDHETKLQEMAHTGRFSDITPALLTYADWTFGQKPDRLADRFAGLRKTQRVSSDRLDVFEGASTSFEADMEEIFGFDVFERMKGQEPPPWERQLRQAYCSPSGIDPNKVFATSSISSKSNRTTYR